jgi:hypothetical protein
MNTKLGNAVYFARMTRSAPLSPHLTTSAFAAVDNTKPRVGLRLQEKRNALQHLP